MAQIPDDKLNAVLTRLRRRVGWAELVLVQAIAALALLMVGSVPIDEFVPPHVAFTQTDTAGAEAFEHDTAGWQSRSIYAIDEIDGIAWLRWDNPPMPADLSQPLAVHISGPFSAEVYWNGTRIGDKGRVGADRSQERAGPIDVAISIPPNLIRETSNLLALRVSSTRAGYDPAVIIQNLYVGTYRADARRSLRYYAPTILTFGALMGVAVALALLSRTRMRAAGARWLVLAITGLLIAISAEVSRSLVSYPYDWHQPRQAVALIGLLLFGFSVLRFTIGRWPADRMISRVWQLVCIALTAIWVVTETGYDAKSAIGSGSLLTGAACWCIWRATRGDTHALAFALPLGGLLAYSLILPGDYLDRTLYVLTAVLLGYALVARRDLIFPPEADPPKRKPALAVQGASRTVYVDHERIRFLKAAGNYTEIHTEPGQWELDHRGLKAVLAELPEQFFRIHRSHAVNLTHARALRTAEGSRYSLEVEGADPLPVSRAQVAALREAMKGEVSSL